jgi:hypothetical protein
VSFAAASVAAATFTSALCAAAPAVAAQQSTASVEASKPAQAVAEPRAHSATAASAGASASETSSAASASRASVGLEPDDYISPFVEPPPRVRRFGLMFDLGSMDGGMMSLVYRPVDWLRVHAGGGTNGASAGMKLGAVVSPWKETGWSFSLAGGHFFPGDVNGLFAAFAGSDYDDSHLLRHFDYDFATLQLGWEIERGDLMFFARGGVGLLWTRLPSEDLARISNLSSFVDPDGSIEALLPTLSLGIIGFL